MAGRSVSPECREVMRLLSQYLDVELPEDACLTIDSHLAGCSPCVEFAESLRKTVALCRSYSATEMPEMPAPISRAAREELLQAYRKMLAERDA